MKSLFLPVQGDLLLPSWSSLEHNDGRFPRAPLPSHHPSSGSNDSGVPIYNFNGEDVTRDAQHLAWLGANGGHMRTNSIGSHSCKDWTSNSPRRGIEQGDLFSREAIQHGRFLFSRVWQTI